MVSYSICSTTTVKAVLLTDLFESGFLAHDPNCFQDPNQVANGRKNHHKCDELMCTNTNSKKILGLTCDHGSEPHRPFIYLFLKL